MPADLTVHLVLDNYATHKQPNVKRWFARNSRFILHFTPTSASWLDQAERFFAEITRRRIRRSDQRLDLRPSVRAAVLFVYLLSLGDVFELFVDYETLTGSKSTFTMRAS